MVTANATLLREDWSGRFATAALVRVEPGPDRFLAPDLDAAHEAVVAGAVVVAAESVAGPLH